MGNVDDSNVITQVFEAMASDPAISRRATIIRLAGEGSLRRIERKMAAIEEADPHALDTARRETVHAAHALRFPVAGHEADGLVGFCARFTDVRGKPMTAFLALEGQRMAASFAADALKPDGTGAHAVDLEVALDGTKPQVMRRATNAMTWFGLLFREGWLRWDRPGGLVRLRLATELRDAWRAASLGAHLDDDELLEQADAAESARLDAAGLRRMLDLFPDGFREALSGCAQHVREVERDPVSFGVMAYWALGGSDRIPLLLELGNLAMLAGHEAIETGNPRYGDAAEFIFSKCRGRSGERPVTPRDAAWLLAEFGRGSDCPMLTDREAQVVVSSRNALEPLIRSQPGERSALVRVLRVSALDAYSRPCLDQWLALSEMRSGEGVSFAGLLADLGTVAATAGLTTEDVARCVLTEAFDLLGSVWGMLAQVSMARAPCALGDLRSWAWDDRKEGTRGIEAVAMALLSGGAGWVGLAEACLAWREAGRPGFASDVDTNHVGRVSECALNQLVGSLDRYRSFSEISRFLEGLRGGDALAGARSAVGAMMPVRKPEEPRSVPVDKPDGDALSGMDAGWEDAPDEGFDGDLAEAPRPPVAWWRRGLAVLPWRRAA